MVAKTLANPTASMIFLNEVLKSSRTRLGTDAALCLDMDVVVYKLQVGGLIDEAKTMLEEAKVKLLSVSTSEAIVFSKVYGATFEYRKLAGPPTEFYNSALMFLAYTVVEDLSTEYKYTLATDMCLASIAGDDIFNFGEVIATPILTSLEGTPNQWMYDLVLSLNFGDVNKFNMIVDANREKYYNQPVLVAKHESIKQKVALLSLVNLAFERPSHERQISFVDIATRTHIPANQVGALVNRSSCRYSIV
jgi:26S proteasome regulatory subunit N9